MNDKTLLYTRPIPLHYALSLMVSINFSVFSVSHSSFIVLIRPLTSKKNMPDIDSLCDQISQLTVDYLVSQFDREKRENLRSHSSNSAKKSCWSPLKRKAPFYDAIYNEVAKKSIKDYLDLACLVTSTMKPPWEMTTTGCPPHFDSKKLAASILVKHNFPFSFRSLEATLKAVDFDARLHPERGGKKSPGHSHLHDVMKKLPEKYLMEIIDKFDRMCVEKYVQTFSSHQINEFSIDSTKGTCDTYVERMRAAKTTLYKETVEYNYCTRLVTNTVKSVNVPKYEDRTRCDTRGHLSKLPEGSLVLADKQFDVEYNHAQACHGKLRYMVDAKTYKGKPYKGTYRRKNQKKFSKKEYRKRKMGERPFGNLTTRGLGKIKYRKKSMRKKGILLTAAAHNMKAYFMQLSLANRFIVLDHGLQTLSGKKKDTLQWERKLQIFPQPTCASGGVAPKIF